MPKIPLLQWGCKYTQAMTLNQLMLPQYLPILEKCGEILHFNPFLGHFDYIKASLFLQKETTKISERSGIRANLIFSNHTSILQQCSRL